MAQSDTRSLNEIQRQTEQARSALLETVEDLRNSVADRIKPAAIKAEMAGYVRSRAGALLDDAGRTAREKPLQTAAVVASIAYPALRLARAVPLPVWLVGAGLFLARSETVAQGAATLREKVSDASSKAASGVKDALGSATEAGDLAASAGASLRETTDKVTDAAGQMSAAATETATGLAEKVVAFGQDVAQSAQSSLSKAAQATSDAASDVTERATRTFFRSLEENPLLVAGVGLFIGGVVASALPRSEVEGELMGAAARSAKRRAQAAADRGIGAVSDAASEGFRQAARQADAEGLDAEGVSGAVRDVGERVRRVAEAAVTTAFEPPEENEQSSVDGGRENG